MTNTNRQQGFIALTITLIILLLVISLSIMTGKVLSVNNALPPMKCAIAKPWPMPKLIWKREWH